MRCATCRCASRADTLGRLPRRGRRGAGPGRGPRAHPADTSPDRPFQARPAVANSALTGRATSNRPQEGGGFWVVGGALDRASVPGNGRISLLTALRSSRGCRLGTKETRREEEARMTTREQAPVLSVVGRDESQLLSEWIANQLAATTMRRDLLKADELEDQSRRFLGALRAVLQNGGAEQDISAPAWGETRALLADLALTRARQGF